MNENRKRIMDEILMERMDSQERWSFSHDDQYTRSGVWRHLIRAYTENVHKREVLIQIAGICLAAIESMDRMQN